MPRAKKGQQKVHILKKTKVLCPSRSYYSTYTHYFFNLNYRRLCFDLNSNIPPIYFGCCGQGILKKAVSNPSLAKLDNMSEVGGAVSEAGGTISEV